MAGRGGFRIMLLLAATKARLARRCRDRDRISSNPDPWKVPKPPLRRRKGQRIRHLPEHTSSRGKSAAAPGSTLALTRDATERGSPEMAHRGTLRAMQCALTSLGQSLNVTTDYVVRRFNASSAKLSLLVGLDLAGTPILRDLQIPSFEIHLTTHEP
jgi:hypothetical protein